MTDMTAKDRLIERARELGLDTEGTTKDLKARIAAAEAGAVPAPDETPDSPAEVAAGAPPAAEGATDPGADIKPTARRGGRRPAAPPAAPPAKAKGAGSSRYICKTTVSHKGRSYGIGESVVLTEAEAAPILAHLEKA